MSFEHLALGYIPDESDVASILRSGSEGIRSASARICRSAAANEKGYEELVENGMIRRHVLREASPVNRGINYDAVEDALEEARMLLREESEYERREKRNAEYAFFVIKLTWDALYRLDPVTRRVLCDYYVGRKTPGEIASEFDFSESTFWRRRREGTRRILGMVSEGLKGAAVLI